MRGVIHAALSYASFLEKQTLETQNPPRRRGRCPGKPGNIVFLTVTKFPQIRAFVKRKLRFRQ